MIDDFKELASGQLSKLLSTSHHTGSIEEKYLTFYLAEELYCVQILRLQEIISMLPITPVPYVQESIRGLINLRGRVVSVVDLRLQFGLPYKEADKFTSIMIARVTLEGHMTTMGLIVDRIAGVIDMADDQINPPPNYNTEVDISFVSGVTKAGDLVVKILDIGKIIAAINATADTESGAA